MTTGSVPRDGAGRGLRAPWLDRAQSPCAPWRSTDLRASDPPNAHVGGARGERDQVGGIRRQHHSTRFGERDDKCIHRRAAACLRPKKRRTPCERLGKTVDDIARPKEPVRVRVATRMSLETLDKYDRRHGRWPTPVLSKLEDHGSNEPRWLREVANGSGVEDQIRHSRAPAHPGAPRRAKEPARAGAIRGCRNANLFDERRDVAICLPHEVLPAQLESDSPLQELGSRQAARFHLSEELFGEIDLHTRHTPDHTPIA